MSRLFLLFTIFGIWIGVGDPLFAESWRKTVRVTKKRQAIGFWQEVSKPGLKAYRELMHQAQDLATMSAELEHKHKLQAKSGFLRTLKLFRQASALLPKEPDAHMGAGLILFKLKEYKKGIEEIVRARNLGSTDKRPTIFFQMGIAYTKREEYRKAIHEYDLYLKFSKGTHYRNSYGLAIANANAAEILMSLGRLEEAIARYKEALAIHRLPLSYWGLAVALDRNEQSYQALETISLALGRRGWKAIKAPDVFFIPAGDEHYYYGLGFLAEGKYKEAENEFSKFLKKLPQSAWRFRAKAHLSLIEMSRNRKLSKRRVPLPSKKRLSSNDVTVVDQLYIRRKVRTHYYSLKRCYQLALLSDRTLQGKISLELVVEEHGKIKQIRFIDRGIHNKSLEKCVRSRLKNLFFRSSFPPKRGEIKVVVPLLFKQG